MAYTMTPARRAALRKAQKASARKRRGKGTGKLAAANRRARRNRNVAIGMGGLVAATAGTAAYYNRNDIKKGMAKNPTIRRQMTKRVMKKARKRRAKRA